MRGMKNKKLKNILSITGYFLLVLALCVSVSIVFHNTYYESVYVSGSSMYPTLKGSNIVTSSYGVDIEQEGSVVDFGIVDTHKAARNNVKRFSIVSTYYPDDYSPDRVLISNPNQKIKRVIALPGETFKIEDSKLYVKENDTFNYIPYTFEISPKVEEGDRSKDIGETTLGEDEYWVLGDHRDKSHDCGSADLKRPIKKDYLIGVLVAIEGQAQLKLKNCVCGKCGYSTVESKVLCPNCTTKLTRNFELKNKEYHWPKYF